MENDMICNFKKCRTALNRFAWITSCSHIFCDKDGTREFDKSHVCPACETNLPGKLDIVRIDTQPTEQFKSMVLAGQKPEVIMEICSRALSFWTYQNHQEKMYQKYVATTATDKIKQIEKFCEQMANRTQQQIDTFKSEMAALKEEHEATKKRFHDCSEKFSEKNRQYQRLQSMYDALRRKCVTPYSFSDVSTNLVSTPRRHQQNSFDLILTTREDLLTSRNEVGDERKKTVPTEKEFCFRPNMAATPIFTCASDGNLSDLQTKFNLDISYSPKKHSSKRNNIHP